MAGSLQAEVRERARSARERYRGFKKGLTPRQERLFQVLAFLTRFTLLAAPFYVVLASGWKAPGLRRLTAEVSAAVLRAAGLEVSSAGSLVTTGGFVLDVTRDSTGWKSVAVFSALVLASGRSLRSKAGGVAAGVVLLLALNVLRIVSMVYAVNVYGVDYELMHTLLWRWGLTAGVIALWASWMWITASPRFLVRRGA